MSKKSDIPSRLSNTLLVSYAPREGSHTRKLAEAFRELAGGRTELVELDLCSNPPELLLPEHLRLIGRWNAGDRDFSELERSVMENHWSLCQQVLEADVVVVAFPIYNFSLPATVKAWIDAIVTLDKTFAFDPAKGFEGLCSGKKAAALVVAGFDYSDEASLPKQFGSATLEASLRFIGMSFESVSAFGVDQKRDQLEEILDNARSEIEALVDRWY